jgi:endonuclease/exonuclease/phosphatase (EEP) superfamily protein YafD
VVESADDDDGLADAPRGRLARTVGAVAWVVVGAELALAGARWALWDRLQPVALLDALGPLPYLGAWPALLVGLVLQRRALVAVALVVVAAQLAFGLPELLAAAPVPGWAAHAPHLVLFDANVYDANPSMAGYGAEIRRLHPDLVTLEEAVPADRRQLAATGALAGLGYQVAVERQDPFAFLVASRYPLVGVRVLEVDGLPTAVSAELEVRGRPLDLLVVHTQAPVGGDWHRWADDLAAVGRWVAARPGPVLVVGDFNATWGNQGFRALLADGLTDAAAARGVPFATTWDAALPVMPPVVRIDHVLTRGAVATSISTAPGPGSDHRALQAVVALPTRPTGAAPGAGTPAKMEAA